MTKLIISDTQYIKITNTNTDYIDADYIDTENNATIRFGYYDIFGFCYLLEKSNKIQQLLAGENIIDECSIQNLGLDWNQCATNARKLGKFIDYYFLSNDQKRIPPYFNSWLYNDKQGNIIFKITPIYPWHNTTKKAHPEKISYKEWIKDYKPTIKTMIPKENISKWIEQAKELRGEIK